MKKRHRQFEDFSERPLEVVSASKKELATRNAQRADPSLSLTRTKYPAIRGNLGNRKPFVYAGFANLCNSHQPLTAHS